MEDLGLKVKLILKNVLKKWDVSMYSACTGLWTQSRGYIVMKLRAAGQLIY